MSGIFFSKNFGGQLENSSRAEFCPRAQVWPALFYAVQALVVCPKASHLDLRVMTSVHLNWPVLAEVISHENPIVACLQVPGRTFGTNQTLGQKDH